MVLTTWETVRTADGPKPEFNSMSYHGLIRGADGSDTEGEPKEWVVKIFSESRVSDEWLDDMFMGQVGWVHRKEVASSSLHIHVGWLTQSQWDAYPKLRPTTSFPSVKLDVGLYYVNSFEPYVSFLRYLSQ
jgi:prenylcysteine oxidase/farnesylcysteine lyase